MAIQEVTSPPFLDDTAQTMVNKLDAIKNAINPNAQGTSYSNATSGLSAENVQEGIDEVKGITDSLNASLTNLDNELILGTNVTAIDFAYVSNNDGRLLFVPHVPDGFTATHVSRIVVASNNIRVEMSDGTSKSVTLS